MKTESLSLSESAAAAERHNMDKYLLGIDIGTSAVKAAVFDFSGSLIADSLESYPTFYPQPRFAEQDPDEWWAAVCRAVKSIAQRVNPRDISAVGIDGQGWAAVAADSEGNPLCRTPIWTDTRSVAQCDEMRSVMSDGEWFEICKNPIQPGYSLPKVLWYKENAPDVFSKAVYILQSNSFIGMRLTGNASQDVSQGYAYHFFDMKNRRWDESALKALGLPAELFPEPVQCSKVIGSVTAQASRETGMCEGIPVIAGGLDAACAALGVGAVSPGTTQEQSGQAGGMSICAAGCGSTPDLIMGCQTVPGMWLLQGGTTGGGGALKWLRETMFPDLSFEEMSALADQAPAGSGGVTFLPYMAGERSPIWNPDACGVFFGLNFGVNRGQIIRACMEGVAYALRHNLETAEAAGARAETLRAMGGSANSRVWTQIKADVTGRGIEVPASDTATTLGAAVLAGVGTGVWRDFGDAVRQTVRVRKTYTPDPAAKAVYDRGYETYRQLYERLRDLMSR